MSDMTSSVPASGASIPVAFPQLPVEKVWRNSAFSITLAWFGAIVVSLMELALVLLIFGLISDGSMSAAWKVAIAAIALFKAVHVLWKVSINYGRNSASFDTASVTFRSGAADPNPVRIPFANIDKITTMSGGTIAINDPDGLLYSFDAYSFFKPSRLAREISDRSGKRFSK
ncbi:MAG TPA: hypothetical protein VGL53_23605 [Bryobacteraceae bacterium]|jgi:hypothetical protein